MWVSFSIYFLFQSHAGSIEVFPLYDSWSVDTSFNPTLVRLRTIFFTYNVTLSLVSIPRWFD